MKNTRLAIVLAALTTGAGCAVAQDVSDRAPLAPSPKAAPVPRPAPDATTEVLTEHQIQVAASKDQMKEVEREMASTQKAMRLAQARAGEAGRTVAKTMNGGGWRGGGANRTLVIPKDAGDAKSLGEVEEDLNVMAHILEKAASGDSKSGRAMGITLFGRMPGWGGSSPNLYIEGYGVLFFADVNYPLLPPPDKDAETDTKETKHSEWDEAKREMAGPSSRGADPLFALGDGFERQFVWDGGSPTTYDAAKVEDLKSDLIAALKNASHIRKLKSDEVVTVVVTGASAGGGGKTIKSKPSQPKEEPMPVEAKARERAPAPGKLVLRTRKSDAEAFQNSKLSLDDFKKKVTVMTY